MIKLLMKILPMVSCKEASRLMSQRMDHRLSLIENLKLEMHLHVCGACLNVLKQFRSIREVFRLYKDHISKQSIHPSRLDEDVKSKLKASLTEQ